MSTSDDWYDLCDSRIETEGSIDEREIIVDCLGNTDNCDLESSPLDLLADILSSAERSVTTDRDEYVDIHPFEGVNDLLDLLSAAAC